MKGRLERESRPNKGGFASLSTGGKTKKYLSQIIQQYNYISIKMDGSRKMQILEASGLQMGQDAATTEKVEKVRAENPDALVIGVTPMSARHQLSPRIE